MNEYRMLSYFCEIAKKHIESLDETDLNFDLLEFGIDLQGPCCSDYELLNAFSNNCNLDENTLYQKIENICLEYCNTITKQNF